MNINTQNLVSITDANQNFPKAARLADKDVMAISKRLIEKNRQAYEELAK